MPEKDTAQVILRRPVYTQPGRRPHPVGAEITLPSYEAAMFIARGIAVAASSSDAERVRTIAPVATDGTQPVDPDKVAASMPPAPALAKEKPPA
ncbi:hypothetical protein [Komagataeibacter swingsii]|uniref:Uncharacterized protein n=1 Tax=Komagataeibacter swingsii TaxID=215220 RepID=A0A2V4R0V4_9PROT|nr:hypothetical protein [Komagataeibacter swingsii]PYD69417.1 hypothetical protein CFR76_10090 [Komagataeibacter swingsii]GBQ65745.1 hypothetical protein AA16373_3149 [Komagataeibacter swingsii DSM 16373]